jgi:hypothetical protein
MVRHRAMPGDAYIPAGLVSRVASDTAVVIDLLTWMSERT